MFQYEFEKPRRAISVLSCDSQSTDWSRVWPNVGGNARAGGESCRSTARALPASRAVICKRVHTNKSSVPLKVWIIAGASCFAVCAILVLATVAITRYGAETYPDTARYYSETNEAFIKKNVPAAAPKTAAPPITEIDNSLSSVENEEDIKTPILEKLSIFKNIVSNRKPTVKEDKAKPKANTQESLIAKPQFYPEHDTTLEHIERKIEKKDYPKTLEDPIKEHLGQQQVGIKEETKLNQEEQIPEFKPTLPDVFVNKKTIKLPDGYAVGLRKYDAEFYGDYFYNDENLYEDYMQSTSMTSYLIEKVSELHDWITNDADFDVFKNTTIGKNKNANEFGQVLKALNESIAEGNVTIIINKLKDIYYGDNFTAGNNRKIILTNRTDLVSFSILTLDVMLLHNIQLMAWENQETVRNKMLKDADVFAFNALFMDPKKVEAKQLEILHHQDNSLGYSKRQIIRQEQGDSLGANILENVLDLGLSTARAAIQLGKAYKNTKMALRQISNKDNGNANPPPATRNIGANKHAFNYLQTSYQNDSFGGPTSSFYTELDCVWFLYCRNLAVTAKLNPPYGIMARINGVALRMLSGELSSDKALDTLIYEVVSGWSDLKCSDMFPRCSKANASSVILESILQPVRKSSNSR